MASYPSALASFAGFTATNTLAADNHAAQHNLEQGEILAVQTKVGTGSSTPSSGTVLRGTGSGTSSWGQVDLTADVTGALPIANGGTGTTSGAYTPSQVDSAISTAISNAKQALYPVGCIYTETTGVNPATTFGFGTWTAEGEGRVLVGNGTSDQSFSAGATGGESTHTLTTTEMPSHTHTVSGNIQVPGGAVTRASANNQSAAGSFSTGSAGSGGAHNNLQPYKVVYFWRRTA